MRKINSNTTVKIVIKPQEERTEKKGRKKSKQNKSKTVNKQAIRTYISIGRNLGIFRETVPFPFFIWKFPD